MKRKQLIKIIVGVLFICTVIGAIPINGILNSVASEIGIGIEKAYAAVYLLPKTAFEYAPSSIGGFMGAYSGSQYKSGIYKTGLNYNWVVTKPTAPTLTASKIDANNFKIS